VLRKAMAGRFVMALFALEILMEGGILAVLGAMMEGSRTKSSLLGVGFEMSAVTALPVTLLLVRAPANELSLSTSVTRRSLAMSSSFKVLGMSTAASLLAICILGEGLAIVIVVNGNIFQGLHFNWCN
jgi:hypothetical protein